MIVMHNGLAFGAILGCIIAIHRALELLSSAPQGEVHQ